jgi:hypothetical protein
MVIDEEAATRLADAIRGHRSRNVAVVDAITDIRYDSDRGEYVLLVLVLSPPAQGADTWPLEDTRQLRADARAEAARLGFPREAVALALRDSGDSQTEDELLDPRARPQVNTGEPDTSE